MNRQLLAAVFLAGLAALATYYYLSEKEAAIQADGTPLVVLVAKQPMVKGSRIESGKLTVKRIPGAYVMPGALASSSSQEVQTIFENYRGQFILVDIDKGEQILPNKLSKLRPGFAGSIKPGQRIMAFNLPLSAAVGGHLQPGNHVDVLGCFEHRYKNQKRTTSVVLVQNVMVTSIGQSSIIGQHKVKQTMIENGQSSQIIVSLSLTPEDALRLSLAEQEGRLKLSLRAVHDDNQLNLGDSHLGSLLGPLMRVEKETIKPVKKRIQIIKGL